MHRIQTGLLLLGVFAVASLAAAEIKVSTMDGLQMAIDGATPGARIVVANGVYSSAKAIRIARQGTAEQPIVIAAESRGGVEITGTNGFTLAPAAAYVVIEGFKFTHAVGGEQVDAGATHCRYTRNVFQLTGDGYYLMVKGDDTEIDRNTFQNKFTVGQMIVVEGASTNLMAQRTWIHQNCFTNFPDTRQNNCSAIQIGLSGRSMSPAHSLVESNLFLGCRGENENICNKSCDNVYRFNTFGKDCSELSLRHGNRNIVYANFFLGSEGIRIFGKDDKIFSNYFQDCRRGIHIGNGDGVVPPDKLTSHDRPDGIQIVFNTVVNCTNSVIMQGRKNGLGATNIIFANNLIVGADKLIALNGPLTHSTWRGNILWGETNGISAEMADGFMVIDPQLKPDASGVYHLQPGSPAIGKGGGAFPYVTVDIDSQPRGGKLDVGADQTSQAPILNRILTPADVGPSAPRDFSTRRNEGVHPHIDAARQIFPERGIYSALRSQVPPNRGAE